MSDPTSRPPLDADRLREADRLPGLAVEVVDQAASTNTLVAERARAGAPEGLVIVAEHQTAGRGRLDRTWVTPPRSALTFSMLLRPLVPARSWSWLPLLTGYSVGKALKAHEYAARVKWPNDVLLGERKVAGILLERVETPFGPAAVVGVGINVGMTAEELPVPEATSLAVVSGSVGPPDRTNLLLTVLATLWEAYDTWQTGGEPARERLAMSYAAACVTLGRDVRVTLPGETLTGRAVELDPDGRLVVQTTEGPRAVGAGDVTHVRDQPRDAASDAK